MLSWVRLTLLMVLICLCRLDIAWSACPVEGDNPSPRLQRLDRLKNRVAVPATLLPVPLAQFLAPGDDRTRWSEDQAVTVTGFVAAVKAGGLETVNCHAKELENRDTHLVLVLRQGDAPKTGMVMEVTPIWREKMAVQGIDWSTATLKKTLLGQCVEVSGWVFFDLEHANASTNTAPHGKANWRQTMTELHPVTALTVVAPSACVGL